MCRWDRPEQQVSVSLLPIVEQGGVACIALVSWYFVDNHYIECVQQQ
jgi:hypothetical protein